MCDRYRLESLGRRVVVIVEVLEKKKGENQEVKG
jgi:hypothetical protein